MKPLFEVKKEPSDEKPDLQAKLSVSTKRESDTKPADDDYCSQSAKKTKKANKANRAVTSDIKAWPLKWDFISD